MSWIPTDEKKIVLGIRDIYWEELQYKRLCEVSQYLVNYRPF